MSDDKTNDSQLDGPQCHFVWDFEKVVNFNSDKDALRFLEERRDEYNEMHRKNALLPNMKRARRSLTIAYVMFKWNFHGWCKVLDNAFRLTKFALLDESVPKPQYFFPEFSSPLWKGSSEDFFPDVPENSGTSNSKDQEEDFEDADGKELTEEERKGMYTALEHVVFALKAEISRRRGSSESEVEKLLENAVPTERMSNQELAALLFVKAATLQDCGGDGFPRAINLLRRAILIDPDNLRWTLQLIRSRGRQQRNEWGVTVEWSESEDMLETIDAILRLDSLKPMLKERFEYEKLQLLQELWYGENRGSQPRNLFFTINQLCEALLKTTRSFRTKTHCAAILSKNKNNLPRVVELIEEALQMQPKDIFINGKACTIYRRMGDYEKALQCAEVGARRAVGSSLQIFELKLILGHSFDAEEFFEEAQKRHCGEQKELQKLEKSAFLYYLCLTDDHYLGIEHFKVAFELDPSAECLRNSYCPFVNRVIHVTEAAYCVVLMAQRNLSGTAAPQEYFEDLQKAIERQCDVHTFQRLGRTTPERYVVECRSSGAMWLKDHRQPFINRMRSNSTYRPHFKRDPGPLTNWRTESRETQEARNSAHSSEEPPACSGSWRNSNAEASTGFSRWTSGSSHMRSTSTSTNWRDRGSGSEQV